MKKMFLMVFIAMQINCFDAMEMLEPSIASAVCSGAAFGLGIALRKEKIYLTNPRIYIPSIGLAAFSLWRLYTHHYNLKDGKQLSINHTTSAFTLVSILGLFIGLSCPIIDMNMSK